MKYKFQNIGIIGNQINEFILETIKFLKKKLTKKANVYIEKKTAKILKILLQIRFFMNRL